MRKEIIRPDDYSQKERPKTRRAQFSDLFRHRFLDIFKVSMLQAVFYMPLVVSIVISYLLLRNASDYNSLFTIALFLGIALLILIPVAYIGLSGVFYALKKLIYNEGDFASSSFFIGMKEEWKNGLISGVIEGVSAAIALIGSIFLFPYRPIWDGWLAGAGIAILAVQFITITIINYYSLAQSVIYENKYRFIFKNSFIITLMRFPLNFLFIVVQPGIFLALALIMEITMYVGVVLLIFFSTFGHLLWSLNAINAFDKFINLDNFPDIYKKGLYKDNQEV